MRTVVLVLAAAASVVAAVVAAGLAFGSNAAWAIAAAAFVCIALSAVAAGAYFAARGAGLLRWIDRSRFGGVQPPAGPNSSAMLAGRGAIALSLVTFLASFFFPALSAGARDWYAGELLVMGWLGAIYGKFGWYANPLLLLSYWLAWRSNAFAHAAVFALVATLLAISARAMRTITAYDAGDVAITDYGLGFGLWVTSCAVALIGFGALSIARRSRSTIGT